ncbi:MAG: phosphate signaling complex protein PhoU [Bacteroidales bacterium]
MEKYRIFDNELEKLTERVVKMSHLVEEQVNNAVLALNNYDIELAKHVIENDNKVDKLDVKIDKLCQKIFALQQPVATDLRYIISSLKINNDLERIGDHAVNIAKRIDALSDYTNFSKEFGVDEVANKTVLLFKDVDQLIKTHNLVLASDIFQNAIIIKDSCHKISEKIIEEMMQQKEVIVVATNIMIIVNLIERIASYSTNVAESIIFVVEGKIVKHQKKIEEEID